MEGEFDEKKKWKKEEKGETGETGVRLGEISRGEPRDFLPSLGAPSSSPSLLSLTLLGISRSTHSDRSRRRRKFGKVREFARGDVEES